MARIALEHVDKVYPNGYVAARDLSLDIRDGELLVVVGPSGCGKSTALRLVAGVEPLSGGAISIGGRMVNDVPAHLRDVAMVFEAGALYPHMTASDNLRFSLALRKLPAGEIEQRIGAESRVLRLGRLLDRLPRTLSAGQRQLVAFARDLNNDLDIDLPNAKLAYTIIRSLLKSNEALSDLLVVMSHALDNAGHNCNIVTQAERYARGLRNSSYDFGGIRAPFLYSTNGPTIWFRDVRHPLNLSRPVAGFHTPAALSELLTRDFDGACERLLAMPHEGTSLRPFQREANAAVEKAIAERKRHMLVAMATGTASGRMARGSSWSWRCARAARRWRWARASCAPRRRGRWTAAGGSISSV